jgi:hypothetical protein
MSAAMMRDGSRMLSGAPRRIGIACVLTGPPSRVLLARGCFPFITYASFHEHLV